MQDFAHKSRLLVRRPARRFATDKLGSVTSPHVGGGEVSHRPLSRAFQQSSCLLNDALLARAVQSLPGEGMSGCSGHDDVATALLEELAAFTASSKAYTAKLRTHLLDGCERKLAEEPLPPASSVNGMSSSADAGSPAQATCRTEMLVQNTDAWHAARKYKLTASRFAAAVGLSPYTPPRDLWAKYMGHIAEPRAESFATVRGDLALSARVHIARPRGTVPHDVILRCTASGLKAL